jgi:hypothetical protein
VTDSQLFTIAGRDLEKFVSDWFEDLKTGGGQMRGLLDDGPDFGDAFLMGNIAARAAEPDSSDEELLLSATLVIAQDYMRGKRGHPMLHDWEDRWAYVCAAFSNVHEVGEHEAAQRLARIAFQGQQEIPGAQVFLREIRAKQTPAERASHEQRMTSIKQREVRAAKLLDPEIDMTAVMLSMPLIESQ